MAFKKEPQKVSVGDVTGADDSLVLTFQVTAERVPLSIRERAAIIKGARAELGKFPNIELGYHTKNSTAKAEKAAAKGAAEPKKGRGKKSAEA